MTKGVARHDDSSRRCSVWKYRLS